MLDVLDERMSAALVAKQKCQDEAEATAFTINLANRLVNGLASENVRWAETVQVYVKLLSPFACELEKRTVRVNRSDGRANIELIASLMRR